MSHTFVIAEDHPLLRLGLRTAVEQIPDYRVVAEVADGHAAVQHTLSMRPDLLLLDMSLPGLTGIETATHIRRSAPTQKILAISDVRSEIQAAEALRAGCGGYLLKDAQGDEAMLAIRLVLSGGRFISRELADGVLSVALNAQPANRAASIWERLSSRERSVFRLIAEGGTNRTAADQLSLSPKTIEKHRANLMRKLHARSAAELMLMAVEMGIIERPGAVAAMSRDMHTTAPAAGANA